MFTGGRSGQEWTEWRKMLGGAGHFSLVDTEV